MVDMWLKYALYMTVVLVLVNSGDFSMVNIWFVCGQHMVNCAVN